MYCLLLSIRIAETLLAFGIRCNLNEIGVQMLKTRLQALVRRFKACEQEGKFQNA